MSDYVGNALAKLEPMRAFLPATKCRFNLADVVGITIGLACLAIVGLVWLFCG